MSLSIRRAEPTDAAALALVGAATFLESYSGVIDGGALIRHCAQKQTEPVYATALADNAQALWIAESTPGASPVGYLHLTPPDLPVEIRDGDLEIKRIYVLDKLQRSGLGRRLLAAAEDEARLRLAPRLLLGVYKGNAKALAFYERVGFVTCGERAFDVGGAIYDDWVLEKRL
jgi:ribosomal protein S18 acetylase RimI-like enzyme